MRIAMGMLIALVLVAGVAGVATHAYNAGIVQGLAQAGAPNPAYGPYFHHGPFGFGFFGLLFPLLFIFLLFKLLGGAFGRRHCGTGVPQMFEEWHRRAHEPKGNAGTV
jgi:hypothetical protein